MTYRQEMHRLTGSIAALLSAGTVPGDDVRAALAGHVALVELLNTVHHDLAPSGEGAVALLGRLLRDQPRRTEQPLSDVLAADAASAAGQHWREVAKSATLAEHYWRTAVPFTRPQGDAAWTEMADIAALSRAVATLDGDVAESLNHVGRWQDAATYRTAAQSGLRGVAGEVQALAATGPLPPAADLRPRATRTLLLVRRPDDLPAALRQLGHLAATATAINPAHVGFACRAVAETALVAAAGHQKFEQPAAEKALRLQAAQLAKAAGQTRGVAAIDRGDILTLQQAQEIHLQIVRMRDLRQTAGASLSTDLGAAVNSAFIGLQQTVDHQLGSGRWLTRKHETGYLDWGKVRGPWDTPELHKTLTGIEHATAQATASPTGPPVAAVLDSALPRRTAGTALRPQLHEARPRSR